MIPPSRLPKPQRVHTARGPVTCAELGSGQPVLALHGAMGGWDQSMILGRALFDEGRRRILAPSRPGFPGTPGRIATSPQDQAAHMFALLDALGVDTVTVAAISGGGPCAIHMALAQPDRISALILVSTVSGPNPVEIPKRFAMMKAMSRIPGLPALMKRAASRKSASALERAFPDPASRARLAADPQALALFNALGETLFDQMPARLRASENDFEVTAKTHYPLEDLHAPTLIIHGTDDPFAPFETQAKSAAERIPGAALEPLQGGGHSALFSHRVQIRAAVDAFLSRVGV